MQQETLFLLRRGEEVASMMHTSIRPPLLCDTLDVTCPSDFPDSDRRKEVVHHEQIPDQDMSTLKKNAADKKSNFVIKDEYSGDTESCPLRERCVRDG